ncbi:MAG: ArsR family transcriptional regulator [Alphaproteobacteria bacterium]
MSGIADIKAEDRRAEILRLLAADIHESASNSVLHRALNDRGPAFRASAAQVLTDLSWLSEQGLVELDQLSEEITVATLTSHGRDVAAGDASVPGVTRRTRGR